MDEVSISSMNYPVMSFDYFDLCFLSFVYWFVGASYLLRLLLWMHLYIVDYGSIYYGFCCCLPPFLLPSPTFSSLHSSLPSYCLSTHLLLGLFSPAVVPVTLIGSPPQPSAFKEERLIVLFIVTGNLYLLSIYPSLILTSLKINHIESFVIFMKDGEVSLTKNGNLFWPITLHLQTEKNIRKR